jgi:hypothetical protein
MMERIHSVWVCDEKCEFQVERESFKRPEGKDDRELNPFKLAKRANSLFEIEASKAGPPLLKKRDEIKPGSENSLMGRRISGSPDNITKKLHRSQSESDACWSIKSAVERSEFC